MTSTKTSATKKAMVYAPLPQTEYDKAMRKTWDCGDTCNAKLLKEGINDDPNIPPLEKHAIHRMKMSDCKIQDCMPHIVNQIQLQIEDSKKKLDKSLAALAATKGRKETHITYYRSMLKNSIQFDRKSIRKNELFLLKAAKNKVKPMDIINMFMI